LFNVAIVSQKRTFVRFRAFVYLTYPSALSVFSAPRVNSTSRLFDPCDLVRIGGTGKCLRDESVHADFGLGSFGVKMAADVPMVTQERAYTSPIWYTP
jgi:hypothetical protein